MCGLHDAKAAPRQWVSGTGREGSVLAFNSKKWYQVNVAGFYRSVDRILLKRTLPTVTNSMRLNIIRVCYYNWFVTSRVQRGCGGSVGGSLTCPGEGNVQGSFLFSHEFSAGGVTKLDTLPPKGHRLFSTKVACLLG